MQPTEGRRFRVSSLRMPTISPNLPSSGKKWKCANSSRCLPNWHSKMEPVCLTAIRNNRLPNYRRLERRISLRRHSPPFSVGLLITARRVAIVTTARGSSEAIGNFLLLRPSLVSFIGPVADENGGGRPLSNIAHWQTYQEPICSVRAA